MGCLLQKEVYSVKTDLSSKESWYEENFNVSYVESMNYVDSVCSTSLSRLGMELDEVSSGFEGMTGVVRIGTSLSSMRMGTSEWHGQCCSGANRTWDESLAEFLVGMIHVACVGDLGHQEMASRAFAAVFSSKSLLVLMLLVCFVSAAFFAWNESPMRNSLNLSHLGLEGSM